MPPRRRDPLRRQVLGTYHAPPKPPVCASTTGCTHLWRQHQPRGADEYGREQRGQCNVPDCMCFAYRPAAVGEGPAAAPTTRSTDD